METAARSAKERADVNDPAASGVESLAPTVEAILMSVERPVSAAAIAAALGEMSKGKSDAATKRGGTDAGESETAEPETPADPAVLAGVGAAIAALNAEYETTGRSFRIEAVAGGFRLMTLPAFARAVAAFHRSRQSTRLSKAALESLSIIAYKQPITRVDLEAIRGVACGEVLRSLIDRRLVTIKGRAEELGRPLLYGTTRQFLDAFGLASLTDLPQMAELKLTEVRVATETETPAAGGVTQGTEVNA